MYNSMLDAVAFLITAAVLGSFAFWLIGYFVYELVAHAIRGPSEQLKSVGSSVLNAPENVRRLPVPSTEERIPPRAA